MNDPLTRRAFLASGSATLAAALAATRADAQPPAPSNPPTPGAPTTFGSSPAVGPEVSPGTFAEAEKLVQVELTPAERAQAAGNWRQSLAGVYERRTGPRKVTLEDTLPPATLWDPTLPAPTTAAHFGPEHDVFEPGAQTVPLSAQEEDIAFAPVTHLAHWIRTRQITSERLTEIYLERLRRFDPKLRCVITLTADHALEQARAADREIAAGHYRGPLHGVPWGAKDLLDTAGIPTTYGAEPYRNRVPAKDAAVTARLNAAGAVLVAKLSLGALALNDVWFGGQTMNPWCLEEGSSGSSAGPGAAVAAGLVGFAIGSETQGASSALRCGAVSLVCGRRLAECLAPER